MALKYSYTHKLECMYIYIYIYKLFTCNNRFHVLCGFLAVLALVNYTCIEPFIHAAESSKRYLQIDIISRHCRLNSYPCFVKPWLNSAIRQYPNYRHLISSHSQIVPLGKIFDVTLNTNIFTIQLFPCVCSKHTYVKKNGLMTTKIYIIALLPWYFYQSISFR